MKKENILFLLLAIITVACIMAIAIAIAERSILIAIFAIVGIAIAGGIGSILRRKVQEAEKI
ncbi:DUF5325 family protein [Bacillus alkalicellulosilyticus]|uniref:DUF5325 family protein n=1 Tax=Alkalihalobacterium alkalicellulosilyticum TaxID=1912214 RepID=UPI0009983FCF|nr:DUF5325 family protein [Bacillus alkalicellulosilyticus]